MEVAAASAARAKGSNPGSSRSTTWVVEATVDSGRVVVTKAEEATRVAARVVSGKEVVVVDTSTETIRVAATKVATKVAVDTTIKVVVEAIRVVEEVRTVVAVAVVAEDNSGILPSSLPTL
jgi:hypothetical protein